MIADELKGRLGIMLRGISLNLEIINACGLHCPSCAIGSIGPRAKGFMKFTTFIDLLDKFERERVTIRRLQMYIDSDPCLHPDLHLFIEEATRRGIKTYLSTMLQSTRCDFAKVIEARPTEFRISMPGWENMSYFQGGAKPEVFDRKFREVCKLPHYPETTWVFFFHHYKTNTHEISRARNLAERNGMRFVAVPAIFMVLEKTVEQNYSPQDKQIISHMIETPEEAAARMKRKSFCACWKQLAVDALGRVFLCELIAEERFIIGPSVFDKPIKEWLRLVRTHEFCGKCIDCKANTLQECFADPVTSDDPVGDANKKRRL